MEDPSITSLDDFSNLETGLVQSMIGELHPSFGLNVGAGCIGNNEALALRADPESNASVQDYEDVDFSTFGTPNLFNVATENTLDGVQDVSGLRDPVLDNTYDWSGNGTASFTDALNWSDANTQRPAGIAPEENWTTRVTNRSDSDAVAVVESDSDVTFATVMSEDSSMTVAVENGVTLTVADRVLLMEGGVLEVDGTLVANAVEAFSDSVVSGVGSIQGDVILVGGTVDPGNGGSLTVVGNYVQDANGTFAVDLGGRLPESLMC